MRCMQSGILLYMHARHNMVFLYAVVIAAGTSVLPFISHASFAEDLRKIHEQSQEERESRREQFKQDILEKRKVMLTKWHDRKQGFTDRLKEEQDKLRSGFEIRRAKEEELRAGSSSISDIDNKDQEPIGGFFAAIKKSAEGIVHAFLPFANVFGD